VIELLAVDDDPGPPSLVVAGCTCANCRALARGDPSSSNLIGPRLRHDRRARACRIPPWDRRFQRLKRLAAARSLSGTCSHEPVARRPRRFRPPARSGFFARELVGGARQLQGPAPSAAPGLAGGLCDPAREPAIAAGGPLAAGGALLAFQAAGVTAARPERRHTDRTLSCCPLAVAGVVSRSLGPPRAQRALLVSFNNGPETSAWWAFHGAVTDKNGQGVRRRVARARPGQAYGLSRCPALCTAGRRPGCAAFGPSGLAALRTWYTTGQAGLGANGQRARQLLRRRGARARANDCGVGTRTFGRQTTRRCPAQLCALDRGRRSPQPRSRFVQWDRRRRVTVLSVGRTATSNKGVARLSPSAGWPCSAGRAFLARPSLVPDLRRAVATQFSANLLESLHAETPCTPAPAFASKRAPGPRSLYWEWLKGDPERAAQLRQRLRLAGPTAGTPGGRAAPRTRVAFGLPLTLS